MGSFLNVVIDRLPRGGSLLRPASRCDHCGHPLAGRDLIPLASYLWLRGRCRHCGARIPRRLPLVEALTGLLFSLSLLRFGLTPELAYAALALSLLLVVFFIDLERGLILNALVYPAAFLALALSPFSPAIRGDTLAALGSSALGGLIGLGVMLLIYLAARGGMGFGDVRLGAVVGALAGYPLTLVALLLSFLAGGLVALVLLALRIRRRGDAVPFGPVLAAAAAATLFYGFPIYDWYLRILHG